MSKKIYNLMDWAGIEEVVYGEAKHPEENLGPVNVGKNTLVRCFFNGAKAVTLYIYDDSAPKGKRLKDKIPMEMHDETGYFAQLLPGKDRRDYVYHVEFDDDRKSADFVEFYTGDSVVSDEEIDLLVSGSYFESYKILGAHSKVIGGHKGIAFVVYAPNAYRVSVVGDFNDWDGLRNQMTAIGETGYFEHFIPDAAIGTKYKYEILIKAGNKLLKNDPYCICLDDGENHESVVAKIDSFKWSDEKHLLDRKSFDALSSPMNVYQLSLSAMCKIAVDEESGEEISSDINIRTIAADVIKKCKEMSFTHVELLPLVTCADKKSVGYKPVAFYALSSRFGKISDYQYFINALHEAGIGVIFDMPYNCFDSGEYGFAGFDGSCIYEHEDERKGVDARTGCKLFNYARPEVQEYLISNVNFYADVFHVDGFKLVDVTSMLYLDYYRESWIPNMYGGNENLEAIAFLKKINKVIHDRKDGIITIADEKGAYGNTTLIKSGSKADEDNSLGFDFTFNNGFMEGAYSYIALDPIERAWHHDEITDASIYQYNENYITGVITDDASGFHNGLIQCLNAEEKVQYANLRAFYGYLMTRTGKKIMAMGQDLASKVAFDVNKVIAWKNTNDDDAELFNCFIKELNRLYVTNPALYKLDTSEDGFEWINNMSANENVIVFARKTKDVNEQLLVAINFANCLRDKYKIGVPNKGKYKEIFSSDDARFGGSGETNARLIPSKKDECDGRDESIRIKLAPLSISVFSYTPYTPEEIKKMEAIEKEKEAKRIAKEKEEKRLAKEKEAKRKALEREKARIRKNLMQELERQYREAEKAIEAGSEYLKKDKKNK